MDTYFIRMLFVLILYTRISGPYGPLILALAEGWLASLTRGFATLNHLRGLRRLSFLKGPFLIYITKLRRGGRKEGHTKSCSYLVMILIPRQRYAKGKENVCGF